MIHKIAVQSVKDRWRMGQDKERRRIEEPKREGERERETGRQ